MAQITFKYEIGDMVTLIKLPNYPNCSSLYYKKDFSPKQYKIDGYKYAIHKDGKDEILYRLYAYCDDYLGYHNWITEDYLEGEGTPHTEDIEFKSIDGEELKIGDMVYTSIYYGRNRDDCHISPNFTFATKVAITDLVYAGTSTDKFCYKFYGIEIYPNGERNRVEDGFVPLAMKNVTEQFIIDFVKACKEQKENPSNEKNYHYEERKKWLEKLGVFEQVCKLYKKSAVKKETKPKPVEKKDTVKEIFSSLSEKQKKEMLKLLTKK